MIVNVYGRHEGRDVKRLTVELTGEHAQAIADITAHIAAASPEPLDAAVVTWRIATGMQVSGFIEAPLVQNNADHDS